MLFLFRTIMHSDAFPNCKTWANLLPLSHLSYKLLKKRTVKSLSQPLGIYRYHWADNCCPKWSFKVQQQQNDLRAGSSWKCKSSSQPSSWEGCCPGICVLRRSSKGYYTSWRLRKYCYKNRESWPMTELSLFVDQSLAHEFLKIWLDNICLLMGIFNPIAFNVITDIFVFISTTYYLFSVLSTCSTFLFYPSSFLFFFGWINYC